MDMQRTFSQPAWSSSSLLRIILVVERDGLDKCGHPNVVALRRLCGHELTELFSRLEHAGTNVGDARFEYRIALLVNQCRRLSFAISESAAWSSGRYRTSVGFWGILR
jgi:hypothetical protein